MSQNETSPPLFLSAVQAGFPTPADSCIEENLNLHRLMVKNPAATFFLKVVGDSMTGAGIYTNDLLVVDRSITPQSGKIVVAVLNGEFTVKKLSFENGKWRLLADNPAYPALEITEGANFEVWGVVTYVVHKAP